MHDLRSASVNNTRLAIVAAWHRLHPFLRYFSNRLFGEIAAFLESVELAKKGDVSAMRTDTLSRRMCMKQVFKLLAGPLRSRQEPNRRTLLNHRLVPLLLSMPRPGVLRDRDASSMWCQSDLGCVGSHAHSNFSDTSRCWQLQFSVRNYKKGGDASVASHLSPWAREQPEEAAFSAGTKARTPAKRPHESSSSGRSHADHSRGHRRHRTEKSEHWSRREDPPSSSRREDPRSSGRREHYPSSGRREDHPSSGRRDEHRSGQHEAHDGCLLLMHASSCVRQLPCPVMCWGKALLSGVKGARLQHKTCGPKWM